MMRGKGCVSADDVGIAEIGQTINRHAQYMLNRHGRVSAVVLLCVVTVLLLLQPLIELPQRISKDYNEGWNAYHADRALGGKILYPQHTDLIANNYPPVSFYLVGSIGRMIGDNIIAGRLVALLSLVGVAVSVAVIVHLIGGSWFESFIGAVFLVGYMAARHSGYVAVNDPQWLGHAVMMVGWVLFIQSKQKGVLFHCAALAMVIAGFVKHTLIPLPLAATIWLCIYDRQALQRWVVVSGLAITTGLAIFTVLYGEDFLRGVFLDVRQYSRWKMALRIDEWFTPALPVLTLGLIAAPLLWRTKQGALVLLYIVISGLWGALLLGGIGVDMNAVFDVLIGLAIAAGLLLTHVRTMKETAIANPNGLQALLVLALVLAVAPVVPKKFYETRHMSRDLHRIEHMVGEDIRFMAARNGPAVCENLALCYWAGKEFEVDLFLTGQKIRSGVISERKLIDLIDSGYFAIISFIARMGVVIGYRKMSQTGFARHMS